MSWYFVVVLDFRRPAIEVFRFFGEAPVMTTNLSFGNAGWIWMIAIKIYGILFHSVVKPSTDSWLGDLCGMVKWPLQTLSDLQLEDKKVTAWITWLKSVDVAISSQGVSCFFCPLSRGAFKHHAQGLNYWTSTSFGWFLKVGHSSHTFTADSSHPQCSVLQGCISTYGFQNGNPRRLTHGFNYKGVPWFRFREGEGMGNELTC